MMLSDWQIKWADMFRFIFCLITLLSLIGCKNVPAPQPLKSQAATQSDPAMVETAEAAASISHALNELNLTNRDHQGMLKRESEENNLPKVLTRLVSIDWAGPVEPLVKQLASGTKMRVKVIGVEPAIPVIVSLRKRDASVYDILQDVRSQVRDKADILVFPSSGVIELYYL